MKTLLATAAAALVLGACHEIPQDAPKPYAGDMFKGDKAKFEQTLADRSHYQNEYLRTHDAKQ